MKASIILLLLLWNLNTQAKDFVLNFEASCFISYGKKAREEIINAAMFNWNNVANTPLIFVRGEDINIEIDHLNFTTYMWDPREYPSGKQLSNSIPHRKINPIICDSDGSILESLDLNPDINGFSTWPLKNYYDFFYVYLNEGHALFTPSVQDFDIRYGSEIFFPGQHYSQQQITSLTTHELGHVIRIGHVNIKYFWEDGEKKATLIRPIGDYPIMWYNNFNSTGTLTTEDISAHRRAIKYSYLGKDSQFSFEAKITQNDNIVIRPINNIFNLKLDQATQITLKINIPRAMRGKAMELITVAYLSNGHQWFQYNGNWQETNLTDLTGIAQLSQTEHENIIFENDWGVIEPVQIYFGLRIENQIYFNQSMPLTIQTIPSLN